MEHALVAGSTGYLGHHLVHELKRRGIAVRALVRRSAQRDRVCEADEVFVGRVTDRTTIRGVADGVDTVFSTIGITRQKDGFTYDQVDYGGNLALLDEATASGVKRFAYVSVLHGRRLRHTRLAAAKERFVDALAAAPIAHTVIRPTGFFSDMAEVLAMARRGLIVLVGEGGTRMNPISGRDLAIVCVDAAASGYAEIEAGGPTVYTQNEIAALAFAALHRRARVWHLPGWIADAARVALRRLTPARVYGPVEFFLAAAMLDGVAPRYGRDELGEFFRREAAAPPP